MPGTTLSTPCDTQLCSVALRHYSNMAMISPVGLPRLSVWGWVSVGGCAEGLAYVFDHVLGESCENLLFWIRDRFAVRAPAFAWDQPKFDPWDHSWVQCGDPWALSGGAQWASRKPQHHMIWATQNWRWSTQVSALRKRCWPRIPWWGGVLPLPISTPQKEKNISCLSKF